MKGIFLKYFKQVRPVPRGSVLYFHCRNVMFYQEKEGTR